MPLILSLETSTDVCSVALHDKKELLAEAIIREPQSHASRLAPLIAQVIDEADVALSDVRAVAITRGPGSYTGLRIGTSTAKGLCYALDIPLIAEGTLELMAYQAASFNSENALLCPMIDARRMEVYCMVAGADLGIIQPVSAKVVEADSFQELLNDHKVLFFGNGSAKCREVIQHPHALFLNDVFPRASLLGEMAQRKYSSGEFEDLVQFKPFYLKEFVAGKASAGR